MPCLTQKRKTALHTHYKHCRRRFRQRFRCYSRLHDRRQRLYQLSRLPELIQEHWVKHPITPEGVRRVPIIRTAINIGDQATCLANENGAASHVPGVIVEGEVTVEASSSDVREIERGGAGPARERVRSEKCRHQPKAFS